MISHENTESKLPVNYVFVDFENIHKLDPALIGMKTVHITLLLGAHDNKLDSTLVEKLVAHASSVQLVRLNASGHNALDLALAFYVGKAAQANPTAYFHIVSKDTGFGPLIEHLQSRHIRAERHEDYTPLMFTSRPKVVKETPEEFFIRVTTQLQNNVKNRPTRKTKLENYLAKTCGPTKTANEIHELVDKLFKCGYLSFGENDRVIYHLDGK